MDDATAADRPVALPPVALPPVALPPGARAAIAAAASVLAGVPPFSELPPVDRARLAAALEEVVYEEGAVIFAEGDEPDGLYILREGLIERLAGGTRLATLEPPAVFGDLALLRQERRSATLLAATPCVVWRLPAERFTRLLHRTPGIGARFAAAVSHRLADSQRDVAELSSEVEALAARLHAIDALLEGDLHAEAAELARREAERLARLGRAADASRVRERIPPSPLAEEELLRPTPRLPTGVAARGEAEGAPRAPDAPGTRALRLALDASRLDASRLEVRPASAPPLPLGEGRGERVSGGPQTAGPGRRPGAARLRGARWPARSTVGLGLAALVLALGWLAPPPAGLSVAAWRALATLAALVPLLALNALPEGIVALGLGALWVAGGVAPPRVALAGFATPGWVLVVAVLLLGAAMAASGLLYRLALWAVAHARSGFLGQASALALAGVLLGPANPNATGRVMLIAPATTELVEALGYAPLSRGAAGLAMAVLIGFGQMVSPFLTSSTTAVLVFAVLPEAARANLSWGAWAVRAAPTNLLLLGGMLAAIVWLYHPRGEGAAGAPPERRQQALVLQRALLGPPSRRERVTLWVTAAALLGFVTQPLHGVDAAWVAVAAVIVLAATGALLPDDLRSVNWSFALFFGILPSMADVLAYVSLDQWLAGLVTRAVGGLAATPVLFVAALALLCYAVSFLLRWQAAAPLLTVALAPVAASAGMDPWVVGMVALVACNGFVLPYQSTTYLALYHGTAGQLFSHAQARPAALAYAAVTLLALTASVPIWQRMGLL